MNARVELPTSAVREDEPLPLEDARLAAVLRAALDAIVILDEDGRVIEWNPAAERIFGHAADEAAGRALSALIGPAGEEEPGAFSLAGLERAASLPDRRAEGDARRRDGTEFPVEFAVGRVDAPGPAAYAVHLRDISDVTDRRRAEEHLLRVTAGARCLLWEAAVRQVGDGFEWDTRVWNEAAAQQFLPLEVRPGESYSDAWYQSKLPEDRARMDVIGHAALVAGEAGYRQEFRCRRADGEVRWLFEDVRIEATAPGRWRLVGVCTDITGPKQIEQALWESEARFAAFMDHTPTLAWVKDSAGRYVYLNRAFESHHRVRLETWRGRTDFEVWPADVAHRFAENDAVVLASSGPSERMEFVPEPDGGQREWWAIKFPFTDRAGNRYVGGLALDVTERNRLEAQVRQVNKLEAIGQLAGGVAHEFNNLLAVVLGHSELMLHRLPAGDPMREHATAIGRAAQRGATLTSQILSFSRRQLIASEVLDLNRLVASQSEMLRQLIGEQIELGADLDANLGKTAADPGLLEQVIVNLVLNARDAMPHGGRLLIRTRNVDLDERYTRQYTDVAPGPYVMVSVNDSGSGIDDGIRDRIFEPFFTTKEVGKGTGLGLSTVYGIVKQSGGHVEMETRMGEGSTFRVYLPRTDRDATPAAPPTPLDWPTGSETILLVEDEAMVRGLAREVLEMSGYRVLEASHGAEALRLCEEHSGPIHLMLTDVIMPGISGPQLVERAVKLHPEMRAVYMSGYAEEAVAEDGLLSDDAPFIRKPFPPRELAAKVRGVLDD